MMRKQSNDFATRMVAAALGAAALGSAAAMALVVSEPALARAEAALVEIAMCAMKPGCGLGTAADTPGAGTNLVLRA